ncbi:hypothetical protein MA16_Dca013229 [Dendrobium catenatum]|uniref:Uncharacterized protein n=1 Tax=Dendrobium catenatum TaxID=906689 RepID=A0A2I0WNG8_9ASPA|nr:hypothetical protein MA16_Dca013229 [Dendrobium catenatum]
MKRHHRPIPRSANLRARIIPGGGNQGAAAPAAIRPRVRVAAAENQRPSPARTRPLGFQSSRAAGERRARRRTAAAAAVGPPRLVREPMGKTKRKEISLRRKRSRQRGGKKKLPAIFSALLDGH